MAKRFENALGPSAPNELSDGEEGTPVVAKAVIGTGRKDRANLLQRCEVVLGPAGKFAAEEFFGFNLGAVEVGGELAGPGFGEGNMDRPGMEGRGELADAGECGRGV